MAPSDHQDPRPQDFFRTALAVRSAAAPFPVYASDVQFAFEALPRVSQVMFDLLAAVERPVPWKDGVVIQTKGSIPCAVGYVASRHAHPAPLFGHLCTDPRVRIEDQRYRLMLSEQSSDYLTRESVIFAISRWVHEGVRPY